MSFGRSDDFFASKNMPPKWSITERGSRPNISIVETRNSLKTNKLQVNKITIGEIKNQEKLEKRVKKKQKEEMESENDTFFGANKTRNGEKKVLEYAMVKTVLCWEGGWGYCVKERNCMKDCRRSGENCKYET